LGPGLFPHLPLFISLLKFRLSLSRMRDGHIRVFGPDSGITPTKAAHEAPPVLFIDYRLIHPTRPRSPASPAHPRPTRCARRSFPPIAPNRKHTHRPHRFSRSAFRAFHPISSGRGLHQLLKPMLAPFAHIFINRHRKSPGKSSTFNMHFSPRSPRALRFNFIFRL
jgi:hypothetical protein